MKLSTRPYDIPLALLAAALVALYSLSAGGGFPLDDSWIHQVYARNLGLHGEWSFVLGQPSAASTSPLYTVLLAVGHALRVPYVFWTHALGALALAVGALLGARIAERAAPNSRFAGPAAGVALALAWHLIWAAASGMETMLFCTLTLLLLWLAARELDVGDSRRALRGAAWGVVAALTVTTRPEGALAAAIIGGLLLLARPAGSLGWMLGAGCGFAIGIAPYLALNLTLAGSPVPNTAAAKQAQIAPRLALSYPQRVADLIYPLIAGGQLLLLPGLIWFAWRVGGALRTRPAGWLWLALLIWPAALIALYASRLPAPFQHGRYVIPALPMLIIAGVIGTLALVDANRQGMLRRVMARTLAICAVLLFAFFALIAGPGAYRTDVQIIEEEMVAPARWIADNITEDELLAVHDIGAVGFFAPRSILDIAGLVNPEFAPIYHDGPAVWALLEARGARYLMAFPDQIPGRDVTDPRLCPLYASPGEMALRQGGGKMVIFALAWDGVCPPSSASDE